MFTPGINIHPEWSDHKQSAVRCASYGCDCPLKAQCASVAIIVSKEVHSNGHFSCNFINKKHWTPPALTHTFRRTKRRLSFPFLYWFRVEVSESGEQEGQVPTCCCNDYCKGDDKFSISPLITQGPNHGDGWNRSRSNCEQFQYYREQMLKPGINMVLTFGHWGNRNLLPASYIKHVKIV